MPRAPSVGTPITAEWDATARLWRLDVGRAFSLAGVEDLIEQTDWKGATRYLWDLRALERGPDAADELRTVVSMLERTRKLWQDARVAILVARNLDFGVGRMFQVYADQLDVEFQVFREEKAALEWLGASSPG